MQQAEHFVHRAGRVGDRVLDGADDPIRPDEQAQPLEPVYAGYPERRQPQGPGEHQVGIAEQWERQPDVVGEGLLLVGALGTDAPDGCTGGDPRSPRWRVRPRAVR